MMATMIEPENEEQQERRGTDTETLRWRVGALEREVRELWEAKASSESVTNIKSYVGEMRDEVKGLRRILITTALTWVAGSGLFLLGVLQFSHG